MFMKNAISFVVWKKETPNNNPAIPPTSAIIERPVTRYVSVLEYLRTISYKYLGNWAERIYNSHYGQACFAKWICMKSKSQLNCQSFTIEILTYILNLNFSGYSRQKYQVQTKVGSAEEPRLASLVPSICSPISAKRSCPFWAQELENV